MIAIRCDTGDSVLMSQMVPFQGQLKKRTAADREALRKSLEEEGLLMPFMLWEHEGKLYVLDGHHRREALVWMALDDITVLETKWPCIRVKAEDEASARKAVIQYSSAYGRITKTGLAEFTAGISPDYKPPTIRSFSAKIKGTNRGVKAEGATGDGTSILRIKVPDAMVRDITVILRQVNGVEIL